MADTAKLHSDPEPPRKRVRENEPLSEESGKKEHPKGVAPIKEE
jgi:hypothetical protein